MYVAISTQIYGSDCYTVEICDGSRRMYQKVGVTLSSEKANNVVCEKQKELHTRTSIFIYCKSLLRATVLILLCCYGPVSAIRICDPKNSKTTCKFSGQCVSMTLLKQYDPTEMKVNLHICTCPTMSCYNLPEDVVCADDGGSAKIFYNDMCRRLAECETQKIHKRVCRGKCGESTCRPFDKNLKRCPEEKEDYCYNGGLCLVERNDSSNPFCRCLSGYIGPRCKTKSLMNFLTFPKEVQEES